MRIYSQFWNEKEKGQEPPNILVSLIKTICVDGADTST